MKEHKELKKLVVACLEVTPHTARELYREVREREPTITRRYEFKSFVKVINFLPEVKKTDSCPKKYMIKFI